MSGEDSNLAMNAANSERCRGRRRPRDYAELNHRAAEVIVHTSGRGIALEWARSVLGVAEPKIRGPLFEGRIG